MDLWNRIRQLFSSDASDDAAERDEYGLADEGEVDIQEDRLSGFADTEAAQAADAQLEELKPPRDPAP